ncbi:MAG TPA: peptidoglycan-associated lipoprotein Pal [Deltaproteobacteria bacterium]|nr:MAG: peptidoglycan-associated lipoprotein [Deltaproteobacteria bacterium GWA2_45_12]HBF13112.1 peptidoglycan-associated lipoprotein Pal [Deltaproteobacteria bacterium]
MKLLSRLAVAALLIVGLNACQGKKSAQSSSSKSLNAVHFDFDHSNIKSDMVGVMNGNAGYLQKHEKTSVTIEGHCDSRGTNEYNLALGDRRASQTKQFLVKKGIESSRMKAVSYGEEKPVCHQEDESCWWKNRRADFGNK